MTIFQAPNLFKNSQSKRLAVFILIVAAAAIYFFSIPFVKQICAKKVNDSPLPSSGISFVDFGAVQNFRSCLRSHGIWRATKIDVLSNDWEFLYNYFSKHPVHPPRQVF